MTSVNLYDILNLDQKCTKKEIKHSYRKLVKEFHPDQPNGNAELFDLIVGAYNILKNDKTRADYDEIFKLSKQTNSDHFKLKSNSDFFYKAQETSVTTKSKEESTKDFNINSMSLNTKHGFDNTKQDKIDLSDANKRFNDIKDARELEYIENTPHMLFENANVDMDKFNRAFEMMHKGSSELMEHKGAPDPWNVTDASFGYSSIDNYEDLYVNDDHETNLFSNINNVNKPSVKLTKSDVDKLEGGNYTKNHSKLDDNYKQLLSDRLAEREIETEKYTSSTFTDFTEDPTMGGYGISNHVGLNNMLDWNSDNQDLTKKFQALMEKRKHN